MIGDGDTVPGWTHPPVVTLRHTRRVEPLELAPARDRRQLGFALAMAAAAVLALLIVAAW